MSEEFGDMMSIVSRFKSPLSVIILVIGVLMLIGSIVGDGFGFVLPVFALILIVIGIAGMVKGDLRAGIASIKPLFFRLVNIFLDVVQKILGAVSKSKDGTSSNIEHSTDNLSTQTAQDNVELQHNYGKRTTIMNHEVYRNLLKKVMSEYKSGGLVKAVSYLDDCISVNKNFLEAYLVRGEIYIEASSVEREFFKNAFDDFEKAIEIDPNNATAFYNRGVTYVKLGENADKAFADFNKAIYLEVNYADAYANRANIFLQKREFRKAVIDCNKAIELSPKDSFTAYCNRGLAYGNLGDFSKALSDYNNAIEQNPDSADAYAQRGACHAKLDNKQEAERDLVKSLELNPQNPNAPAIREFLKETKRSDITH